MIKFTEHHLPYSERVYIAFRIAFLETQERLILAEQLDLGSHRSFGYLTHVPFLRCVPAQVQLDLLLEVWDKHLSKEVFPANYLDEAIVYSACETAAHLIQSDPQHAERLIGSGPLRSAMKVNHTTAAQFQQLHIDYTGEGHFLLISQYQDLPPEKATRFKEQFGIIMGKTDSLYDALSRWNVQAGFADKACGLLTDQEISELSSLVDFSRSAGKINL